MNQSSEQENLTSRGQRVLVIDDSESTAAALATVLRRGGYDVRVCYSGGAALSAAVEAAPDAVLVDIHLPDINGLIVSQKLRETLGPSVPIIAVSGDTSMENLNALAHVGATYFLSKPLSATHLLERLKEWCPLPDAA